MKKKVTLTIEVVVGDSLTLQLHPSSQYNIRKGWTTDKNTIHLKKCTLIKPLKESIFRSSHINTVCNQPSIVKTNKIGK